MSLRRTRFIGRPALAFPSLLIRLLTPIKTESLFDTLESGYDKTGDKEPGGVMTRSEEGEFARVDDGLAVAEDPKDNPRALENCRGVDDGVLLGAAGGGLLTKADAATATG